MKYTILKKQLVKLFACSVLTLALTTQTFASNLSIISFAEDDATSFEATDNQANGNNSDSSFDNQAGEESNSDTAPEVVEPTENNDSAILLQDTAPMVDAAEPETTLINNNTVDETLAIQYALKVGDKDRKKDCPQGNVNINTAIEEYALALDGSFPNFYFSHEVGDLKAIQCCSMANHIMFNIFGEDIYDVSNHGNTITSNAGQSIYEFLKTNNAKSGDVLFSSYTVKGKIRPHYIVINGYDENGIWFTDGYAIHSGDEENSPTVIAHICSYENYDYAYFKDISGSSLNTSVNHEEESLNSEEESTNNKQSTYWRLYPVSQNNWENISKTKWVKDTFVKEDLKKQINQKLKDDGYDADDEDDVMHFHKKPIHTDKGIVKKNMLNRRKQRCNDNRETRASAVSLCPSLDEDSLSSDRNIKRSTD